MLRRCVGGQVAGNGGENLCDQATESEEAGSNGYWDSMRCHATSTRLSSSMLVNTFGAPMVAETPDSNTTTRTVNLIEDLSGFLHIPRSITALLGMSDIQAFAQRQIDHICRTVLVLYRPTPFGLLITCIGDPTGGAAQTLCARIPLRGSAIPAPSKPYDRDEYAEHLQRAEQQDQNDADRAPQAGGHDEPAPGRSGKAQQARRE